MLPWLVFPNFVGYNVRRWIIDINKKSCLRKPVLWGVHNWLTFYRNSLERVSLTMYRILVQQPTTLFKIGVLGSQKFDSYKNCANFNFYLLTKLHKKILIFLHQKRFFRLQYTTNYAHTKAKSLRDAICGKTGKT